MFNLNKNLILQARSTHTSLFSADWDFQKMGIGGLDEQFIQILRRAFASRVFPPEVTEQLGVKHVKGLLLFGPPGMILSTFSAF